ILNFKLKNYEKMQSLYEELYLVSKKLYENGVMAKPNFIKSAHDLAEITTTISSTKEEKLTQLALIKKLSGMDIGRDDEFLPLSKSKGVQKDTLFENSINSMRVKMLIIQKEQELKSTKAKLLPSLSIYGKYDLYGGSQDSYQHAFDDYRRNGYRLGIHFSWNIFGGFRVQNELKIKRLELLQAKLAYEEAKDEYESEQLLIKSQIEVEQNKLNSVKDSTKHTGEILELSERLFSEGEGDKITQLVSKINLYRTFIDEHEAKERLSYSHKKREIMNEGNL
ncbi:MAG: TolC family protein, partial [Campylobacteraceae bacterium]|nr:TolC family protein [Campylobacteraceae bacterium]